MLADARLGKLVELVNEHNLSWGTVLDACYANLLPPRGEWHIVWLGLAKLYVSPRVCGNLACDDGGLG